MAEQRDGRQCIEANKSGMKDLTNNSDPSNCNNNVTEVTKPTSLSTLIIWNISKALEKNPSMDIKGAIKAAQARLACERDVSAGAAMIGDSSEQRHMACAVLAWQQLGHSDADSLYQFIEKQNKKDQECTAALSNVSTPKEISVKSSQESKYSKDVHSMSFGSTSIGPVVKLPVETKIVMRLDSSPSARNAVKKPKAQDKGTIDKIDAACCLDSACVSRLAAVDKATTELRMRTGMLARREAERVELLERAESAWRDLELGYQRRLNLAQEKEDDLTKQIQKIVEERNGFKNTCTSLATQLKEKGEKAEKDRAALGLLEKEVCNRACLRLKLSEEAATGEAVLAEHLCRAAQLDRDLQFKEEQARRKLLNFQSELESSQTITHETERAMRAELASLREQVAEVSEQLLKEDAENAQIRSELEDLRQEKMGMVEDLEGCKEMCDSRMQKKIDELKQKTGQLAELKEKVTECRCKLPVDATVEVKRTVSLAALCQCTPEEKILESCSCTSLRSSILSNLLADLFSGLQSEMGGTGNQMPCQLLKCLEDKHNWDRASIVKSNLKNYFAQLLIGELDIAIATSIEKYHAKWVGQSCADTARMIPDPGEAENEGWQERAIERRAQKLATKLAEQLFQERADQLTKQAKDIVTSGPPPCKCEPPVKSCGGKEPAKVFQALVSPTLIGPVNGPITPANTPAYWRQTMQDVTHLRKQIEDLKKESIKKADLKLMEEKITKIVQRGPIAGKSDIREDNLVNFNATNDLIGKKEQKPNRATNQSNYYVNLCKPISQKKKLIESHNLRKGQKPNIIQNNGCDKAVKPLKKLGQTYAINMCMCSQKDPSKLAQQNKVPNDLAFGEGRKDRGSKDIIPPMSNSVKQTKPINSGLQSQDISTRSNSKSSDQQACRSNCVCFHKVPSNTSIDKLLETLTKWKSDLSPCETVKECENETPRCIFLPESEMSELNIEKNVHNDSTMPFSYKKGTKNNKNGMRSLDTNQKEETVSDIEKESTKISKMSTNNHSIRKFNSYDSSNDKTKSTTMDAGFIAPTESEYMGAINLEKSNEDFCKCINNSERTCDPPNEPFQYMPCKCRCKNLATKQDKIQAGDGAEVSVSRSGHQKDTSKMPIQSKNNENQIKKSEIFPSDCGYDIKFLGVTLTDVNSNNQTKASYADKEDQLNEKCQMRLDTDRNGSNIYRANITDTHINVANSAVERNKKKVTEAKQGGIRKKNIDDNLDETKTEKIIICEQSKLIDNKNTDGNAELCQMPSCECKVNFDEFKKYVEVAFKIQQTNEDKGFDVQSFGDNINEAESCVCCDKQNLDDSMDLEKNTFHLLEEHLKKKLEQFKENSCNSTCIPPAEEEKLFNTILKRVKQVITDSTNKIACKCTGSEENSQGSWNRAYGLLQEYLKTKIKRVQCSCIATADSKNENMIPELLSKVCNLIEGDFKRLKDVCGCKNSELKVKDSKQVYFKDELPEKDTDVINHQNSEHETMNGCNSQNLQASVINKENISSRVLGYKRTETKSCQPLEPYQTLNNLKSFDAKGYDGNSCDKKVDSELFGKNGIEVRKSTESCGLNNQHSNLPYVGYATECVCKNIECTNNTIPFVDKDKTAIVNYVLKKSYSGKNSDEKRTLIPNNKAIQLINLNESINDLLIRNKETNPSLRDQVCCNKADSNLDAAGMNGEIKMNQLSDELTKNDHRCNLINSALHSQKNENASEINGASSKNNDIISCKPYIGYTIDCSCDTALGACICTKSILQTDSSIMDSIIKKSMPNDKYYEKVSYIMKSYPRENSYNYHTALFSDMSGDLYLHNILKHKLNEVDSKHDCETAVSFGGEEDINLKSSREYIDMAHTTTNTIEDIISLDTDYSNADAPLDWCDCCSQMPSHDMNSDQFKHSIYFPMPLEDFDNHSNYDLKKDKAKSVRGVQPTGCDCDMVPICHVKMLVENIENKLVSAKCTCDSMKPKVCPVHSTKPKSIS